MATFPKIKISSFTKGDSFIEKTEEFYHILKAEFKDALQKGDFPRLRNKKSTSNS